MAKTWQLQEAKNKFSELVAKALNEGPQFISRRGIETAVVMSLIDFKKLSKSKNSLVEYLAGSPLRGVKLNLERDRDLGRRVDLEVSD